MLAIGDSSAVWSPDRVLSQHQAALTLIKDRVENPALSSFRWLDIACGRGQILSHAGQIFSPECRHKIDYMGVDIIHDHCLQTEESAKKLFANARVQVCEIDKFDLYLQPSDRFDVVTFTNTVHEISPEQLSTTFVSALNRVSDEGFLYLYDMETLPSLELGAVPWHGKEVEYVLHKVLSAAGEAEYLPVAATWPHKSCNGWHMHINRRYLTVSADAFELRRAEIERVASAAIREVLSKKLLNINALLDAASLHRSNTAEEQTERTRLTYDFWSVARALSLPLLIPIGDICEP